mmetsp:Transcript_7600/g.18856  ORF Transcript_7600/g.18856 Transcript_7600/m.18856 type:complete len:287 (-) Transcript_7600:229-1089(-)
MEVEENTLTRQVRHHQGHDGGVASDNETRNPDLEAFFMRRALHVAKEALAIGEVPVGCVIVLRDVSAIDPTLHRDHVIDKSSNDYDTSPSVIISHGANQVNATRDATRHAETVAIDRMLTRGRSCDQMKLPPGIIRKSSHGKVPPSYSSEESGNIMDDHWTNIPQCKGHWKNDFGWGSGKVYDIDLLSHCDLYVTCEPCIMCAAALSMVGIKRVFFGCKNDRFGGCGSLLNLHKPDALPSPNHHGFSIHGGILEVEAISLLRCFYDRENFHAPDHKRKRKPATDSE